MLNTDRGRRTVGGQRRRLDDPLLRVAVERHAVERAKAHYLALGASRIDELGKPYDLLVHGLGAQRHVEVKGSTTTARTVELTVNEVTRASNYPHTDLVVVDNIAWSASAETGYQTSGGVLRVWSPWVPDEDALSVTRFLYDLPEAGDVPSH